MPVGVRRVWPWTSSRVRGRNLSARGWARWRAEDWEVVLGRLDGGCVMVEGGLWQVVDGGGRGEESLLLVLSSSRAEEGAGRLLFVESAGGCGAAFA